MSTTLRFPYPVVPPSATLRRDDDAVLKKYAVFLLVPPYERPVFQPTWESLESDQRVPGAVVGVRLTGAADWSSVEPAIRSLRARLPAVAITLLMSDATGDSLYLSARAARAGVRAVVSEDAPLEPELRRALTCRDSLADDVVEWLMLRRLRISPMVGSLLHEIFTHAPHSPDLSTLLARAGMAESSARFRLHKRLLPTPSRWFQAARALHSVMRVQAEPRTGLLRIAHDLGYSDHSALSQLVYRSFRVRPGAVRGTLGWEWLMNRWMHTSPEFARAGLCA